MVSVKKIEQTYETLKNYNGENPFMLKLKRDVCIRNGGISDFIYEYVSKNANFKPKSINKIVKIAKWYGEQRRDELNEVFTIEKIKIITLLGEINNSYHCVVKYRQSIEPSEWFIPKKAVITNFLVEDYTKLEIDFERYNKLSNYKRVLFEHQKTAVKFLISRKKCILADDMGLGKTTSLSVAAIEGNFDSVLIICPASLKGNWKRELSFYIPEKDITIIDGFADKTKGELEEFLGYAQGKSKMTKAELLEEAKNKGQWKDNRIVIINYDIVDKFFNSKRTYTQAQFDEILDNSPLLKFIHNRKSLLIIDEAHELSNTKSIRYKTIRGLINKGRPDSIYLATGTPITNNPVNFFSVMNLLNDAVTSDWEFYMKRYCGAEEFCKDKEERRKWTNEFLRIKGKSTWYDLNKDEKKELNEYLHKHIKYILVPKEPSNLDELSEKVAHIYLRREKDILTLPNKTIHKIVYELNDKQRMEYNRLWEEYSEEKMKENPESDLNKDLLESGIYRRYLSNEMIPHTKELVDGLLATGEKVVIACSYDNELYTLKEYYDDKCVIFNGKMSLKQKDDAVEKFMSDNNIRVFIGNIDAAGVGITLISSCKLVFNDFEYVPGLNKQMSDRVYRIGQTKDVDIYYQIFKDTQYEKMWNITVDKQNNIDTVIKTEENK